MVTSEIVTFEAQFHFFNYYFKEKHAPFLGYSILYILIRSINIESCDIMCFST